GVGPFAIEDGLVAARDPVTSVRIHNVNTGALVEARVQTPGGAVTYEGTTSIPGVSGTAAPVALRFHRIAGGCSGALFPTGQRQERIGDVPVTLLDCATAVMLVPAASLGADMAAGPEALRADTALRARIEALRLEAGRRMGFGDVSDRVLPKPVLIGAATDADLTVRYFTPWEVHRALAVTGGIAIAAAIHLPGTVAAELAGTRAPGAAIRLRHPAGILEIMLESDGTDIAWAEVTRTARRLFEGKVLVPAGIWNQTETVRRAA
ncbi:MAG: 4-oxalomesaconate tautomerase, partial [Rhodospirillales bacterium]|nr:4-oxalomesaconate tautomerase [Rhodospirillales bacterium]